MKTEISSIQLKFKEKLIAVQNTKGLKNHEIATITGRSESTVSEILRDKRAFADNLIHSMLTMLNDYMQDGDLVTSLRQYTIMMNIAKLGKEAHDMRLIVGNTGIGKSVVFKKFAAENKACFYFKIDRHYSWNKFLLEINRVMGIDVEKRTTNALLDNIIRKSEQLSNDNPKLIIDEAEIINKCIWKNLKNLRTATEDLLSIDIVGITDVKNTIAKMAGLEIVRYNKNENQTCYTEYFKPRRDENNIYTTFARRLKVFHITTPTDYDIEDFCRTKGITNKKVIELACQRWWNYAMADNAVKKAVSMGLDLSQLSLDEFEML